MARGEAAARSSQPPPSIPSCATSTTCAPASSGAHDFVQFHVDLPAELTVGAAHEIIDRVEEDLCRRFPGVELLIHIDPEGHVDEPDNPLVEEDQFAKLEDTP